MKRRISILGIIAIFLVLFLLIGIPGLRKLKSTVKINKEGNNTLYGQIEEVDDVRVMNHYAELPCKDSVTGEIDLMCQSSAACDNLCQHENKGCGFYDMSYNGSDFSEQKCKCLCKKENLLEVGMKSMK